MVERDVRRQDPMGGMLREEGCSEPGIRCKGHPEELHIHLLPFISTVKNLQQSRSQVWFQDGHRTVANTWPKIAKKTAVSYPAGEKCPFHDSQNILLCHYWQIQHSQQEVTSFPKPPKVSHYIQQRLARIPNIPGQHLQEHTWW